MNPFQMIVASIKSQDPYMRLLKYIVGTIVIGFLCFGIISGLLYLSFNLPYIRANIAISQAKANVAPLYERLSAITSSSVQVKGKTGVRSGMYAFSLSDGAEQYAHVWGQVDLQSDASLEEVVAPYKALWLASGFSEVSTLDKPSTIANLFQSTQDQDLVTGICRVTTQGTLSSTSYVAFIDYANGPRCDNPGGRYVCLAHAYCTEQ